MPENDLKHLIKSWRNFLCRTLEKSQFFTDKNIIWIFMAIGLNNFTICLEMHLRIVCVRSFHSNQSCILGHFSGKQDIFREVDLPVFSLLIKTQEKYQNYFNLSAYNYNLNHSNLSSSMHVWKWDMFLAHSVYWNLACKGTILFAVLNWVDFIDYNSFLYSSCYLWPLEILTG